MRGRYPFHLRPKNKQALQYLRMAVDIVNDLELDQAAEDSSTTITEERLSQIRTYLSTYYLSSSFSTSWGRHIILPYTPTTTRLLQILESHSPLPSDKHLVWMVRLQHVVEEISSLTFSPIPHPTATNEYQLSLLLRGMTLQLDEWEAAMTPAISSLTSIQLALLFARIYIHAAPILPPPALKRAAQRASQQGAHRPDADRLAGAIPTIKTLFELILSLDKEEMNSFDGTEWVRFIKTIIIAVKMSFPLEACEGWRDGWARREIGLGDYLERLTSTAEEGNARTGKERERNAEIDVVSASKVVLKMVKKKFVKRTARMDRREEERERQEQLQQQQHSGVFAPAEFPVVDGGCPHVELGLGNIPMDRSMQGCPMIDGSMDSYLTLWDESFVFPAGQSAFFSDMAGINPGSGEVDIPLEAGFSLQDTHNDLWQSLNMTWES